MSIVCGIAKCLTRRVLYTSRVLGGVRGIVAGTSNDPTNGDSLESVPWRAEGIIMDMSNGSLMKTWRSHRHWHGYNTGWRAWPWLIDWLGEGPANRCHLINSDLMLTTVTIVSNIIYHFWPCRHKRTPGTQVFCGIRNEISIAFPFHEFLPVINGMFLNGSDETWRENLILNVLYSII